MKQFIKQHKYHLIVLTILLIITGISGYQYWKISNPNFKIYNESKTNNEIQTSSNTEINTTLEKLDDEQKIQIDEKEKISKTLDELASFPDSEKIVSTTYNLQSKTYELKANDYPISSSTTVYNLMQFASADFRQPFLFETKDYGNMGLFVNSINNLKNNNQTGEYWIYYINDESAKIGISNYIIKPNDIITWKYEKSTF